MLSVIIPTYTNDYGLFKLISQLKKIKDIEIIIVDNKPNKEKVDRFIKFCHPEFISGSKCHPELVSGSHIIYLPQQKNLGFAKAVNLASKKAKGDWLLILNDDIEQMTENLINKMLNFAKKNHFDAVCPVLKKKTGEVENYGYKVLPIGRIQLITNHQSPITSHQLDGLTAACLFIKKQVFEKIGGFDENFFAYLEDVDLFLRLKKKGFRFALNPNFFVIHNHMTTSSKMGFFKEKQDFINWIRVIIKNWGLKKIILHLPGIIIERGRNLSGLIKKVIKVYFNNLIEKLKKFWE
jgi:GT2 family glycosyltransferase